MGGAYLLWLFKLLNLGGYGLWNQPERQAAGEKRKKVKSVKRRDCCKAPKAKRSQPKGADGLASKCKHGWCICCKLHMMAGSDAIMKNEGRSGILAPDSLGCNSSSSRDYIPCQTEIKLSFPPTLTGRWPAQWDQSRWTDYLLARSTQCSTSDCCTCKWKLYLWVT